MHSELALGLGGSSGRDGRGKKKIKPADASVVRQQTDSVSRHVDTLGGLIVPATLFLPPPRKTIESDWSLVIPLSINIPGFLETAPPVTLALSNMIRAPVRSERDVFSFSFLFFFSHFSAAAENKPASLLLGRRQAAPKMQPPGGAPSLPRSREPTRRRDLCQN